MLKIGHRGAAGHCFENSFESFQKAIELKVDFIELDINFTKDKVPYIFHDSTLDSLTNCKGFITNYTSDELNNKVRLNNGEKIPTLNELLVFIKQKDVSLYLEIKAEGYEQIILDCLEQHPIKNKVLIASFYHSVIKKIKQLSKKYKTIALFEGCPVSLENLIIESQCDYVSLGFESTNKNIIDRIKTTQRKIIVWTIDNPIEISLAYEWGVDGIVSNFPERIIQDINYT